MLLAVIIGGTGLRAAPGIPITTSTIETAGAAADCSGICISDDGSRVVFVSGAANLVGGDANDALDVFLRDRNTGLTHLISRRQDGAGSGRGASMQPALTPDGNRVVFESEADDLVANDTNGVADIFLHDVTGAETTLISVSTNGTSGNGRSWQPSVTPDGRYVLFVSLANDLVAGVTNDHPEMYVRDVEAGVTLWVTDRASYFAPHYTPSTSMPFAWGRPSISDDGRHVVFCTERSRLVLEDADANVDVFLRDLTTNRTHRLSGDDSTPLHAFGATPLTAGRYVAFQARYVDPDPQTLRTYPEIFLVDLEGGTTHRITGDEDPSVWQNRGAWAPLISADGRYVLFGSFATNLVETAETSWQARLWLHDVAGGTNAFIGVMPGTVNPRDPFTEPPLAVTSISADGGTILYERVDHTLVLRDRDTGHETWVATNIAGAGAAMTPDGRHVAFLNPPAWEDPTDPNPAANVHVFDRLTGQRELVSPREGALASQTANGPVTLGAWGLSAGGRWAAVETGATDLAPGGAGVARLDLMTGDRETIQPASNLVAGARQIFRLPVISRDGSRIAFESVETFFEGDPVTKFPFFQSALWLWNEEEGISVPMAGLNRLQTPGPSAAVTFSDDSRRMAFLSAATNVTDLHTLQPNVYFRELDSGSNRLVSLSHDGTGGGNLPSRQPSLNAAGSWVLYLSEAENLVTNNVFGTNVYLWDAVNGSNKVLNVNPDGGADGGATWAAFVGGGRCAAYRAFTNIHFYDPETEVLFGTLTNSMEADLDHLGRYAVSVTSESLLPVDTNNRADVYRHDLWSSTVELVSVSLNGGNGGDGASGRPRISPDGRWVVFQSRAEDLVANDGNGWTDVFLRDMTAGVTMLLSVNREGTGGGNGLSANANWSPDGTTIVFESYADDLATADYNETKDLFLVRLAGEDVDGDGLPDDWEMAFFGDLSRDGSGDWDGDGLTDREEHLAGTDPTNEGSVLRVITLERGGAGNGSGVTILWEAVPGKLYQVEYKDEVDENDWRALGTGVVASSETGVTVDESGGGGRRFYRVRVRGK